MTQTNLANLSKLNISLIWNWFPAGYRVKNWHQIVKKTQLLLLGPNKLSDKKVICNGEEVEESKCVKYVGVKIDNKLTFEEHIEYVQMKCYQYISISFRCYQYISKCYQYISIYYIKKFVVVDQETKCHQYLSYTCTNCWNFYLKYSEENILVNLLTRL